MESENLYNRLPKYWIYGSFAVAMLLDFIPLPSHLFHWLPEFTAMMLMYWLINRPQRVDMGTAFVVGVLVDIGTAAPLGQHALSYLLASYVMIRSRRQVGLHPYGIQAIAVFFALLCNEVVLTLVRLRFTHNFAGWLVFLAPIVGALLWPMLNKIMVSLLNFRYLRR